MGFIQSKGQSQWLSMSIQTLLLGHVTRRDPPGEITSFLITFNTSDDDKNEEDDDENVKQAKADAAADLVLLQAQVASLTASGISEE